MGRKSSITALGTPIQKAIAVARERGATIDEICQHIRSMGAEVSRSAMGRHIKRHDEITARMRESRELASAVVDKLGERDDKARQLVLELVNGQLFELMTGDAPLAVSDLNKIALAVARSAKAERDSVATIAAAREEARREALDQAKATLADAGNSGVIDAEAAAKAMNLLGLA